MKTRMKWGIALRLGMLLAGMSSTGIGRMMCVFSRGARMTPSTPKTIRPAITA